MLCLVEDHSTNFSVKFLSKYRQWGFHFSNCKSMYLSYSNKNQRNSGPVNVHLTPGPGIYFNAFIHVYPQGWGRQPLGDKCWCKQKALIYLLQVSKLSLRNRILYTFLMTLYMYTALGQRQTTPWGQTFDVNRKPLSLCPFVAGLKTIVWKSDFIYNF